MNLKYAEEHNSLWKDLKTKDFLYGSYFRMIVGPYAITNGVVTGIIKVADRTVDTGWQPITTTAEFPLRATVSNYKKLLLAFADETVGNALDPDVQLYFQEIDVDKYIYLNKVYNERDDLYTKVSNLAKGNKITVNINGTDVTYDYSVYRGACRNYNQIMYMYPNTTYLNNASSEPHRPSFVYNNN